MSDIHPLMQWKVGDTAYIHTDGRVHSKGDMVKVTLLNASNGHPLVGKQGHDITGTAYRVLVSGEYIPAGTVRVRVGNYWADENVGTEQVVNYGISGERGEIWAVKSIVANPKLAEAEAKLAEAQALVEQARKQVAKHGG